MRRFSSSLVVISYALTIFALLCLSSGCTTTADTIAAGVVGGALLAQSPNNEIEQIYYLGVFDPQEQVPPTVYRVRVHGQASAISATKFASGWVKADLIDSLGTSAGFNTESGSVEITPAHKGLSQSLPTGRKLMLFGPEGFREAPKDHRLVIVMGASPDKFFNAVDEALGVISQARVQQQNAELNRLLFEKLRDAKNERERLDELAKDVEADMPQRKEMQ